MPLEMGNSGSILGKEVSLQAFFFYSAAGLAHFAHLKDEEKIVGSFWIVSCDLFKLSRDAFYRNSHF